VLAQHSQNKAMEVCVVVVALLVAVVPFSAGTCGSKSGGPQDNPVAALYGNGTIHGLIPW